MRVPRRTLSERGGSASDAGCLTRSDWDMPSEMTAMPRKMKLGGYATHMVGKVRAPLSVRVVTRVGFVALCVH